jgi:hypothetical protein
VTETIPGDKRTSLGPTLFAAFDAADSEATLQTLADIDDLV